MRELTPRDRRLLARAAWIAAAALFLCLFLLPTWRRHSRAEAALAEARAAQEEILRQLETAPAEEAPAEEALPGAAEGFYPFLRSDEVDELVTGLLLAHNLTPLTLTLTEQDPALLAGYPQGSLAGQTALPDGSGEELRRCLRTVAATSTAWGSWEDCLALLDDLAANSPALRLTALELDDNIPDPQHREEFAEPGCRLALSLEVYLYDREEDAP